MSSRSYSDEQAAAIAAAVLDRGMTQEAARDAGAQGELHGLAPFRFSLATTQRVVSRERTKRLQAEPFDVRSARLAKRALTVAEREMTRLELCRSSPQRTVRRSIGSAGSRPTCAASHGATRAPMTSSLRKATAKDSSPRSP